MPPGSSPGRTSYFLFFGQLRVQEGDHCVVRPVLGGEGEAAWSECRIVIRAVGRPAAPSVDQDAATGRGTQVARSSPAHRAPNLFFAIGTPSRQHGGSVGVSYVDSRHTGTFVHFQQDEHVASQWVTVRASYVTHCSWGSARGARTPLDGSTRSTNSGTAMCALIW